MSFRAEKIFNTAVTAQEIPLGYFFALQGRKNLPFMKLRGAGDMLKEEKTIKQKAKNIYILFFKLCENNVK